MERILRTEVLTQFFYAAIPRHGGHPNLFDMCVDWIVTPRFGTERSSYVCLHERTAYVVGLYNKEDLDIAVIGFDLVRDTCIVRQIQGQFDGEGVLPRCWERVLLGMIVDAARFCRFRSVEVIPSWENRWAHGADNQLARQLRARYDETPGRVGFRCANRQIAGRHALEL